MNQSKHFRCTYEFDEGQFVEIVAENDLSYFYYVFITVGINEDNNIPELILDKRKICETNKKNVSAILKPIYVIHKSCFDQSLIMYRSGMTSIFFIEYVYEIDSIDKTLVDISLYRMNSYYDSFCEKVKDQDLNSIRQIMICGSYYNTFINERFEYFKFLENIFLGVSLLLEKTKLGEHSFCFEMNVNPAPVMEFISLIKINYINGNSGQKLSKRRINDVDLNRIKTHYVKSKSIEIIINDYESLFPFLGNNYYEHIFKKPNYTGVINMTDRLIGISAIDSNISISYDMLRMHFKLKAPIFINSADDSNQIDRQQLHAQLSECKCKYLDTVYYDPLLQQQMKCIIIEIISSPLSSKKKKLFDSVWIGCIVIDDNRLKEEPKILIELQQLGSKHQRCSDLIYWYSPHQFDSATMFIIPELKNKTIDVNGMSIRDKESHKFKQVTENIFDVDIDIIALNKVPARNERRNVIVDSSINNLNNFINHFIPISNTTRILFYIVKELKHKLENNVFISIDNFVTEIFEHNMDVTDLKKMLISDFDMKLMEEVKYKKHEIKTILINYIKSFVCK